jgi:hypothetical protein
VLLGRCRVTGWSGRSLAESSLGSAPGPTVTGWPAGGPGVAEVESRIECSTDGVLAVGRCRATGWSRRSLA